MHILIAPAILDVVMIAIILTKELIYPRLGGK